MTFLQDKGIDISDFGTSNTIRDSDRTLIQRMYNCSIEIDELIDGSTSEGDEKSDETSEEIGE